MAQVFLEQRQLLVENGRPLSGQHPKSTLLHRSHTKEQTLVFLAVTPDGLRVAQQEATSSGAKIWCGADAVSAQDFAILNGKGVTRFAYELGARDPQVLAGALDTIDQHHPGETVWVEAPKAQQ